MTLAQLKAGETAIVVRFGIAAIEEDRAIVILNGTLEIVESIADVAAIVVTSGAAIVELDGQIVVG